MDAVDGKQVGRLETGDAFHKRFGNPYGVIHRVNIHQSILETVQGNPLIKFRTSTQIVRLLAGRGSKSGAVCHGPKAGEEVSVLI